MKKIFLLLTLCLCATLISTAQTQTGIVRTLEKSKRPSQGIDGVNVEILEYPNAIVSKKGGKFSFTLKNKKLGDAFKVSRVTKKGYTLVDKYLQGRNFSYSPTVPIEIVMVSDKQLANDKKQIEDKALAKAKKTYEAHIAELEHQFEEKTINEKAYYAERERLLNNYDNYIKLIDEMAERYALTDYKGISDINREILKCIENAELERADSLINSKGDFNQREQELRSQMEFNQVTAELLTQSQKDAEFKLNDLAQDYYNKFTILAANYKNDSAAYYLERRAALDTTNASWQADAGLFIYSYLANYFLSLKYYQRGLQQTQIQYGEFNNWTRELYSAIGNTYLALDLYSIAKDCYEKAIEIAESIYGNNHPEVVSQYNNLGSYYFKLHDFEESQKYYLKSLEIIDSALDYDNPHLGTLYHNLSTVFERKGNYDKAIDYSIKAIKFDESHFGSESLDISIHFAQIGHLYSLKGYYEKAIEYLLKALSIQKVIIGENHPMTADTYTALGQTYRNLSEYDTALEYFLKDLAIKKKVFGPECKGLAESYTNIGETYIYKKEYDIALEYLQASLAVDNYNSTSYVDMGGVYYRLGVFDKALEYYNKGLIIRETIYGKTHPFIAIIYNNIGALYNDLGEYDKALEYHFKALDIREKLLGREHPHTARTYSNIGAVLYNQKKYKDASEYYNKALVSDVMVFGSEHPTVASDYHNIGMVYYRQGNYTQANDFFEKVLEIKKKVFGTSDPAVINTQYLCTITNYTLHDFLSGHCLTATVGDGGPAQQQGMSGEYVLLEFGDWTEDSYVSLFDESEEMKGKPKDIVVLKDGVITKHHFEDMIGVQFGVKEITHEERERINQLYEIWKRENK